MISTAAVKRQRGVIGKTHYECPICGSRHLEYEFIVERAPVCACQDCGLLFLSPQPEEPSAAESLEQTSELDEISEAKAAERLRQLIAYSGLGGGRLLLIGAKPLLVNEARKMGFEISAVTPSEFESTPLDRLGCDMDACILMSLETAKDPLKVLQSVRCVLKKTGSLMLVAPTIDSQAAKLFRASWWEFGRKNLFYFSVDTLQNLLTKAGFTDPMVLPERSLVSIHYLKQKLNLMPRHVYSRAVRTAAWLSPGFLHHKTFRLFHSRTQMLARPRLSTSQPKLSVIVPVFNEQATFVELIEELLAKTIDGVDIEIIIVESGSTDGSRELVQQYERHARVRIIWQDSPKGKGYAVRAGLKVATGDVVLFQDADLEYDINDYDALIDPILSYRCNFVIGSRHGSGRNSWKLRQFADSPGLASVFNLGHIFFLTLFNVLYRQKLTDPFSMFKVFRRDCLWGLSFECNRFDFDHEIVIKLLRKGYKAVELPVNYKSRSLKEGKKVTIFRDPLTWLRALWKFRNSPLYRGKVE
jgi:hypothetical protein